MVANVELHNALLRLENKVKNVDLNQALKIIDEEIAEPNNASFVPHFEVHKASVLKFSGKLEQATTLLINVAKEYSDNDSVYFFAGQYLLELGDYNKAINYLSKCITLSNDTGEHWNLDSAYLLRAYCAAKIGNKDLADCDLEHISDDGEMSWIPVYPMISKNAIKTMLKK